MDGGIQNQTSIQSTTIHLAVNFGPLITDLKIKIILSKIDFQRKGKRGEREREEKKERKTANPLINIFKALLEKSTLNAYVCKRRLSRSWK